MRYQNLDLWVEREAAGGYIVQGKSSQGDFRDEASVDLASIAINRDTIATARIDDAALKLLGRQLFTFLFRTRTDEKLETLLDRTLGSVGGSEDGVRIRLQLDEANPDVAAMPWEYLYRQVDSRFLATQVQTSIVRFLEIGIPLRRTEATLPLRLLPVMPAVEDLAIDRELEILKHAIGSFPGTVTLGEPLRGIVTIEDLQERLAREPYDILHFAGHGDFHDNRATLRFSGADLGAARAIDDATFGKILSNHLSLKLVVLNSCQGATLSETTPFVGMAPRIVAAGVPAVIAMQFPIRDDEALCFAKAFYGALFSGQGRGSVDYAISSARGALDVAFGGQRAFGVPALFMRYDEGILFRIVTGNLIRDSFSPGGAKRDAALIREHESSLDRVMRITGELPADPQIRAQLAEQGDELDRARRRLRLRNWSLIAGGVVAVLVVIGFAINLLNRLPFTWFVAASPVWFGDPLAGSLDVSSIAIVTTPKEIDPTWRRRHAALVDRLSDAGARVVVLDLYFHEPRPADDSILAAAFARAHERGTEVVFGAKDFADGAPRAVAELAKTASTGVVCLGENDARFSGIVPVFWAPHDSGGVVPSLALMAVAKAQGTRVTADLDQAGAQLVDSAGTVVHRVRANRMVTVREAYPDCPMFSEGSRYGELLSARAPTTVWRDQVRRFDYAAVLAADTADLHWAQDRIVLVGAAVPTEEFTRQIALKRDVRYGVERHADAIATILSDAEVRSLGGPAQLAFIAAGAVAGWWIAFRRSRRRRLFDVARVAAALGILLLISAIGYRFGRTLVDIVYPAVALLLAYAVVSLLRRHMVQ